PAEQFSVDRVHAFHIDPDRRSELTGKPSRSSDLENFSPSRIQLQKLEAVNANFGLKLAPATEMWEGDYEIEFIGHDRECKQQVVWGGQLAQIPGVRASVIQNNGQVETFFVAGKTVCQPELVSRVGRYILDPHSCLLSAKLVGEFALKNGLRVLCQQSCYLSGDVPLDSKLATCFEVQDVLKPKIKLIENYLAEHGIGAIEVKKRGPVDSVFEKLKRLKGRGQNSITLVTSLTPWGVRVIACQRILGQCRE
ncbi:MAG: hypothetical protein VX438_19860, partial [Planctomycetota bacterium]|nr:hypothetical protein [Planctomycetota bacterium]